jgi:tRNA pseudouridine38-40 synthase
VRVALGVEYDGCRYHGWQRQKTGPSVQEAVERALTEVADEPVAVTCAGRTDSGVHATGQVVHFDTGAHRTERQWTLGANSRLPDDIAIRWARTDVGDFHARFDARSRSYLYTIFNHPVRSALLRDRVFWVHRRLDVEAMAAGAAFLVGRHDFSSFRAAECQANSPVRTVSALEVVCDGALIRIGVTANAFLHHMVRNIAGSLVAVGKGRYPASWIADALAARDRRRAGMTAPPAGLCLVAVDYGDRLATPANDDPPTIFGFSASSYDDWWKA